MPGEILVRAVGCAADQKLDAARLIELRRSYGPPAVHRVEVERGRAAIRRRSRLGRRSQLRTRVERHVVIDELTQESRTRSVGRIVRIVDAQAGISDQQHESRGKVVLRIEISTPLPDV